MELQHINVKIFAEQPQAVDQGKFTPIFQRWIQEQACEELLIDVADYLHVPAGPGIVLIGNEADYSMDDSERRLGLRYNRKTGLGGDNLSRFKQALRSTLTAARRLELEPLLGGNLKFNRQELDLFVNDRALAPNNPETLNAARPELENFFKGIFNGNAFELQHDPDPRVRFGVKVKLSKPFDLESILKKL
jgi:hypothetical protein